MSGSDDPYLERAKQCIEEYGWFDTHVFPDEDAPSDFMPFSYTAGFTLRNHPELIGVRIAPQTNHTVFWWIYERVAEGKTFRAGDTIQCHDIAGDPSFTALIKLVEVIDVGSDLYPMSLSMRLYGPNFPALQTVYSDANQRFPWDEGFDIDYRQPLLGIPL